MHPYRQVVLTIMGWNEKLDSVLVLGHNKMVKLIPWGIYNCPIISPKLDACALGGGILGYLLQVFLPDIVLNKVTQLNQ